MKEFTWNIDAETLTLIRPEKDSFPSWTRLGCKKCPNCPLDENQHPYCPAATGISDALESLQETLPIKDVNVSVETAERNFSKSTTLAEGLSSMLGLAIVSSGCPVFGRLKPLARNHLPFETPAEQVYRSLGMYLLYQKFSEKNKDNPDWKLSNFTKFYDEINTASEAFCSRLSEIAIEEDSLNTLTHLDCFTKYIDFKISEENIDELKQLFKNSYH